MFNENRYLREQLKRVILKMITIKDKLGSPVFAQVFTVLPH